MDHKRLEQGQENPINRKAGPREQNRGTFYKRVLNFRFPLVRSDKEWLVSTEKPG